MSMTTIKEVTAKGIITKSKLPDADYVVNPYTGCEFGCAYCYASFMGRFVNEPIERWGEYVYVKQNAVELFRNEIDGLNACDGKPIVLLSSVTDPYQGVESKYRLTEGILRIAAERNFAGLISILTKSALVERDIPLLQRLQYVEVGLTITTTDDSISRFLEVRASSATRRIKTLQKLNEAGLPTYAFIGPLLPHFIHRVAELEEVIQAIAAAGTREVYVEHMNLAKYIRLRLNPLLAEEPEEIRAVYDEAAGKAHRERLREVVHDLLRRYNLKLRLGDTIVHKDAAQMPGRKAHPGSSPPAITTTQ